METCAPISGMDLHLGPGFKFVDVSKVQRDNEHPSNRIIQDNNLRELKQYLIEQRLEKLRVGWHDDLIEKDLQVMRRREKSKIEQQKEEELNKKRLRLAELLDSEEEMYQNMRPAVEGGTDVDRLMARYTELKLEKERQRQKLVEEKRELQFRQNCEELRSLMSKKLRYMTTHDLDRIEMERESELRRMNEESKMYDAFWAYSGKENEFKDQKEREFKTKKELANEQLVKEQIHKKNLKRVKIAGKKAMEAEIMEEQKRLLLLEEECQIAAKRGRQEEMRRDLEASLEIKRRRELVEAPDQEEMPEECNKIEKKKSLMHEQQEYLQYMREEAKKALEREREASRLLCEQSEMQWEKEAASRQLEKQKRKENEAEIRRTVKLQIIANEQKLQQMMKNEKEYSERIFEEDAIERDRLKLEQKLVRERNLKYQNEILDQIRVKEEKIAADKDLKEEEFELLRKFREQETAKVQKLLEDLSISNEHPYRRIRRELFGNCDHNIAFSENC